MGPCQSGVRINLRVRAATRADRHPLDRSPSSFRYWIGPKMSTLRKDKSKLRLGRKRGRKSVSAVVEIDNKDSGGDVALRSKRVLIERLGRLMAAKQFSARSLSRAAGLADTYVNDVLIRKNLNPSYTSVQSIAKVLGT